MKLDISNGLNILSESGKTKVLLLEDNSEITGEVLNLDIMEGYVRVLRLRGTPLLRILIYNSKKAYNIAKKKNDEWAKRQGITKDVKLASRWEILIEGLGRDNIYRGQKR